MSTTDQLPAAPDSEKYIIGTIIAFPDDAPEVFAKLRAADFVDPIHRAIFDVFGRQHLAGGIDPVLAAAELKGRSVFGDLEPAGILFDLGQSVATGAHVAHEAGKIIEARRKRQLHAIGEAASHAAMNGESAESVFNALRCDVEDFGRAAVGAEPRFPIISAAELAVGDYRLEWTVERLLVELQFCILGGPKKSLKTTLAIVLAICIALGVPFLGAFPVLRRRRVLVCSCESGLPTIKDIASRVCDSLGVNLADVDNLQFSPNVPKPNIPDSWAEFSRTLEDSGAEVLILDALYRMLSGDGAENLFKMAVPLDAIDSLCQSIGVTPIVCHHFKTSRLNQFDPADMDDLAFAGCAEFMRQGVLLSRREQYLPGSGLHRLWLSVCGSAGHNSLWALDIDEGRIDDPGGRKWDARLTKADEARDSAEQRKADAKAAEQEKQLLADREAVCRALVKHPGGLTKTTIGERSGVSGRRWPKVFAAMLDSGELVPCDLKVSNHKQPITGYTLNPT